MTPATFVSEGSASVLRFCTMAARWNSSRASQVAKARRSITQYDAVHPITSQASARLQLFGVYQMGEV